MHDILKLLAKYSYIFLFIFLEVIAFSLIVRNNQAQRDIFITSSNTFTGKLFAKVNKIKRLFQMDDLMDSLMQENIFLREQLNQSQYTYGLDPQIIQDTLKLQHYQYIHAKVVDKTLSLRNNYFTINKGFLDGIEKGMGVIDKDGVIGVIQQVNKYFSTIIPLANTRLSISVVLESSGALGNLVWDGFNPKRMIIEGVPKHISVKPGDEVFTSGYSLFPRGIAIGKVQEVNIEPGSNFYKIDVILNNDPYSTYNVEVVKNLLTPIGLPVQSDRE